jgi:hypothetical protein
LVFRLSNQPARRCNPITHDQVKEEVERLLDVEFIRPCQYAEWVSIIVPMEKKNTDKIQVCIDFHNLNKTTPKDGYHMPIADMLINNASGHRVISFLMVMAVIINFLWPKRICPKWFFVVLVLSVYLNGLL